MYRIVKSFLLFIINNAIIHSFWYSVYAQHQNNINLHFFLILPALDSITRVCLVTYYFPFFPQESLLDFSRNFLIFHCTVY
jgi:hypothetical protein